MSVCNVWVSDGNVLVAVDTAGRSYRPENDYRGEPGSNFSKILTIPHSGVLFACRGEKVLFYDVFRQAYLDHEADNSFDALVSRTPGFIAETLARIPGDKPDEVECVLELYVIGWSDRLERMCAELFIFGPTMETQHTPAEELGATVVPIAEGEEEAAQAMPRMSTPETFVPDLFELVNRQVAYGRHEYPDVAFGGDLILAEVRRYTINLHNLGPLE